MPRFALLEHDHPYPHFDLMLEAGPVLWTWRLDMLPWECSGEATRITDHRLIYLDYEGPISGARGSVRRLDGGEFAGELSNEDLLTLSLAGGRLKGTLCLQRREGDHWQLTYRPDPAA